MAELIAVGPEPAARWRRALVPHQSIRLGRAPRDGWAVPWDPLISREHLELRWDGERLQAHRVERARNPVFYRGQAADQFVARVGDCFVIGTTSFYLVEHQVSVSLDVASPCEEHTFHPGDLRRIQFRDADHRLEVLSHFPEVISGSLSDDEFHIRLVNLLLAGIPHAEAAALVERQDEAGGAVRVVQWDRRREAIGRFEPSHRLILEALARGDSVLHVWAGRIASNATFTISDSVDWAFCIPVPGEACRGWALYVAGSFGEAPAAGMAGVTHAADLKGDVRFAELVAELIGSLRQVRLLERQRNQLSHFLSPMVLDALSSDPSEHALEPREADVTVLFCDVRGFSREAEHWRDNLAGLLKRVSEALGVMTHHILGHGGVIGDFQGDAAMGFWGWPLPGADGPLRASLAALEIRGEFQKAAQESGHPLADFHAGIGIAHGRAVAGKIGTPDHAKLSVFGPVVNLASRLEEMTKQLRVPILLDERTADYVREHMPRSMARTRRLGRVRPYGLETPLMVSELLPPADQDPVFSDRNLADYESAVDALLAGRWSDAIEHLHRVPAKDRAKDFLTIFIAQHNYEPPPHWDGVIPMPSK